jgi:hypothetical protein
LTLEKFFIKFADFKLSRWYMTDSGRLIKP